MFRILFICCGFVLLAGGCAAPPQKGEPQVDNASPRPEPSFSGVNGPVVAAVCDCLRSDAHEVRNTLVRLHSDGGTLFLDGLGADAVSAVRRELGAMMPVTDTNCAYFHDFRDTRSGKQAQLLRVRTMSAGSELQIFKLDYAYAPVGGETILVEVRFAEGRWRVVGRRLTGAA
jgi:hypothetical protein